MKEEGLLATDHVVSCFFGPVRDFSNCKVSIQPAEHASWSEARQELMSEAKAGLKARLEAELGSCEDQEQVAQLRADFRAEERKLEHDIDHTVHTFSAHIDISYNVSRRALLRLPPFCVHSRTRSQPPPPPDQNSNG